MPSMAEAFGMMAIEAMSCGRPVLCFEGTSLPGVTFAPDAGIAVPAADPAALAAVISNWIEHPRRRRSGDSGQESLPRSTMELIFMLSD
jgi:glycosyltransferase involved in cell wall biosynthesis